MIVAGRSPHAKIFDRDPAAIDPLGHNHSYRDLIRRLAAQRAAWMQEDLIAYLAGAKTSTIHEHLSAVAKTASKRTDICEHWSQWGTFPAASD